MRPGAKATYESIDNFLNELEQRNIFFKLAKYNDGYVMFEIAVPGERWEVEFSSNDVRIEKFKNDGTMYDESETEVFLRSLQNKRKLRRVPVSGASRGGVFPKNMENRSHT